MVYSISFQVLGNEQDAEECAQDSFFKGFQQTK
jgi:DNA-directed RNA polymerase specialized sigma24 family protein